jgi:hypothetical protein
MKSQKITAKNYDSKNGLGIEGLPLKIGFFNDLLDDLTELITSYGSADSEFGTDLSDIESDITYLQTWMGPWAALTPQIRTSNPTSTGDSIWGNIDRLDAAIGRDAEMSGAGNVISRSLDIYQNLDALDARVRAYKSVTTNATGGNTAILSAIGQFVTIISNNVDHIVSLPSLTSMLTGGSIHGSVLSTGCELRVHPNDQVSTKYINGVTGGNELKLQATSSNTGSAYFEAVKINISRWIVKTYNSLGAPTTVVPDK